MDWTTELYLIPYLLSLLISSTVGILAWRRRSIPGATPYAIFALLQASMTLGYVLELLSKSLDAKVFWDNTQFIGTFFSPLAFLLFCFEYTRANVTKIHRIMKYLLIVPILSLILILTDDFHRLVRPEVWIEPGEPFSALKYDFSPAFVLMSAYVYALVFYGLVKLIQRFVRAGRLYRSQTIMVLIGVCLPLVGASLTLAGVEFSIHRDTTPITFAIGNLFVAWGLLRYRLFDIVPVAREKIFESISDAVTVLDAKNRVVDINPAALKDLGKDIAEIIGKPVAEVYADWPDLLERYKDVHELHEIISIGDRQGVRYHDLRFAPLLDRWGRLTGRLVVDRDITERVQAEDALRESEIKYRNLVESTADWVWSIDTQGQHTFSNTAIQTLLGYEVDEIVGVYAFHLIHTEDRARIQEMVERSVAEKKGWSDVSIRWIHKDGSVRFMESTAKPVLNDDGELIGFNGIDRDVTERKRAEQEIRRHATQLEATNRKLEEANARLQILAQVKDEFVSNVSHELRTPISNLKLYLHLLNSHPDRWDNYMATLERETDRLASMIEGLLLLSRMDQDRLSLHFECVDLNTIVETYVLDRTPLAESLGLDISFQTMKGLPCVKADPLLIGQVLSILLTNALNYTPTGGRVVVGTHERNATEERWVGFSVSDNGPGLSEEEQEQLFTRFFRGKAGRESEISGTGLGLAIAKEIVDQHSGRVEVESTGIAGEGATFRVWLRA